MDLENTATEVVEAETEPEVAAPAESSEEGSNYQEVANPESEDVEQSHEDNQKFQAMRHEVEDALRRAEEAERKIAEYEAERQVKEEVYASLSDDEDFDEYELVADAYGVSAEEVKARVELKAKMDMLERENAQFKAEKEEAEARAREAQAAEELANQLADLQKIDPSIKTVADFEEMFAGLSNAPIDYLDKGMSLEQAYWALKSEKEFTTRTPPPEVGGIKSESAEKEYLSKDDVMAMTSEERTKNWKLIRKSQEKWT